MNRPKDLSKRIDCNEMTATRSRLVNVANPPLSLWLIALLAFCWTAERVSAQKFVPNYEETLIPDFDLPAIWPQAPERFRGLRHVFKHRANNLNSVVAEERTDDVRQSPSTRASESAKLQSADAAELAAWKEYRSALYHRFAEQMFGTAPPTKCKQTWLQVEAGTAYGNLARRQQFVLQLQTESGSVAVDVLVYTPAEATGPVPAFLAYNFYGNHTLGADPAVRIPSSWCRSNESKGVVDNRGTEAGRGASASRWPVEDILSAGYGLVAVYYGDVDPDTHDEFQNGVHQLFPAHRPDNQATSRWGSIAAWAWGLSRVVDGLEKTEEVDSKKIIVLGHSRLGKTALWAGASDSRFAGIISNDSGCGGAAISRRAIGETVWRINTSFPHWFCASFSQYNRNEAALPFDQHQLIALLAPRPVYVASATEDRWADPKGEFMSVQLGSQAYALYGLNPIMPRQGRAPQAGERVTSSGKLPDSSPTQPIAHANYHLRSGKHDLTDWDWHHYLEFMRFVANR